MYREITKDLVKWKDKSRRKPLLLTGVRQCGKTYIVNEFAREHFKSYLYVNFESEEKLSAIFDYDFDVTRIIAELERHFHSSIIPGETLVFFDEIQTCPRAITALKYFCENMRALHIICAGSSLGVALKREIPELYKAPMEQLLKEYYIVGGMPEVVKTWIETHDYDEVEEVQNEILSDYADDFSKHAPLEVVLKIRWMWDCCVRGPRFRRIQS